MLIFGIDEYDQMDRPMANGKLEHPINHIHSLDYINKKIEDIDTKYYYPIYVTTHSFWTEERSKYIKFSKQAVKDLQSGRCKLFISFTWESLTTYEEPITLLNIWIKKFKLPYNSIILTSGNYKFGDSLKNHRYIKYIYYGTWERTSKIQCYRNRSIKKISDAINQRKEREKVFLCYNRRPRGHRFNFVNKLYQQDLLKYGYVSLGKPTECNSFFNELIEKDLFKQLPLSFDNTNLDSWLANRLIENDFLNSYISIVSETSVSNRQLFVTEKTFKPIMMMHPFIIFGNPEFLKFLRMSGYRTFSRWIDESYDLEFDLDKRIDMIINEIKKLCKMSHEQLQNMLVDMSIILKHNFDTFINKDKNKELQYRLEEELLK